MWQANSNAPQAASNGGHEKINETLLQKGADVNASVVPAETEGTLISNFETMQLRDAIGPSLVLNQDSLGITSLTACGKLRTLPLPLELREQIYDYIIPGDQRRLCYGHLHDPCWVTSDLFYGYPPTHRHSCYRCNFRCDLFNVIYCNRQMLQEVCSVLARRPLHFVVDVENIQFQSNIQFKSNISCVRVFKFLAPRIVRVDINPWQSRDLSSIWKSLLSLFQLLRRSSYRTNLQIRCEARASWSEPLYGMTDPDPPRAKGEMVLLLQPFNLVHSFEHVEILILGGPLKDPWSKDFAIQEFAARLAARMEARTPVQVEHIVPLPFLTLMMTKSKWHAGLHRLYCVDKIYATFLRGSQLTKVTNLRRSKRSTNENQFRLPSKCNVCSKTFESRNRLFMHLRDFHATPEIIRLSPHAQARRDQAVRRLYNVGIL